MLKIYLIIFTLNYCELGINNFVYHSICIVLFETDNKMNAVVELKLL